MFRRPPTRPHDHQAKKTWANPKLCLAAVCACFLAAPQSHAGDLWAEMTGDGEPLSEADRKDREYRAAMKRADTLAITAMRVRIDRDLHRRRTARSLEALLARAVDAYEKAAAIDPEAGEPHYRAAELINRIQLEGPINTPTIRDREAAKSAIKHWSAFERLSPLDQRVLEVLDRLAIVHTKLATPGDFEHAIAAYEAIFNRTDVDSESPRRVSRWLGNLAETYMMVGRLDDAVNTYRRALDYSSDVLYGYGLAVALDRDGQGEQARQVMWAYVMSDQLRSLESPNIFFVPEGERYYYYALGHEANGNLDEAARYYKLFVASGAHPHFQPRAEENLCAIEKCKAAQPAKAVPVLPRGGGF